ncbi:GntR family transcriptional regulator [Actibacterium ureilyticum]|uniref:GntR family transcriptional regulator n=1 Tax=Actibacterium ureilyticum TaxID=1590614 RepID=UPI000BAAC1EC|nr:GntR family transcriptional regulator [Actibacterium ureilyticum]
MEPVKAQKTLVEQTYDILLDAICSGEIQPGERLNQDDLAVRLNVSRQPVNSAISILRAQRLVADTGRRGVVVAPIDMAMFQSIHEMRQKLDPFAAELACLRKPDTAPDEAAAILDRGARALAQQDARALLQADVDFHAMLYRWSGNTFLEGAMALGWNHTRRFMAVALRTPSAPQIVWTEHRAILERVMARDTDAAAALMRDHLENAIDRLGFRDETGAPR